MSLLVMSTDSIPSKDRLFPSWTRSLRRKSVQDSNSRRPSTSNGFLSPRPTPSRSNSDESRSARSQTSTKRASFRGVVNRLRSSSSASSLGARTQDVSDVDIHDWFAGFRRYNQRVTTEISPAGSHDSDDFAKTTKTLTKNCGGQLIHSLPEAAFDFSLLWCPASELASRDAAAPSWSWTSQPGPVNFPFDPTTCPDVCSAPKSDGEIFRSEITNFHVGPADALYTVRRDKSSALRTKFPPYFHAPFGSAVPAEQADTLRFSAQAISADGFTAEQMTYNGAPIPCCELLNASNQHCGVVMSHHSSISAPSSTGPFEFILLSRNLRCEPASHTRRPAGASVHPPGTPLWDGERFVWDQVVVDFDDEVFEDGPWKMLNVMLVKWDAGVAERVAIARIHEDAWLAGGPTRRDVVLR
jgi:hypothetical protein